MKFPDLAVGARFVLDGEPYVKSGPLVARNEASGRARLIGRYLVVAPLGEQHPSAPTPVPAGEVNMERVMAALDTLCRRCEATLDGLMPLLEERRLEQARAALAAAREEFLAALGG